MFSSLLAKTEPIKWKLLTYWCYLTRKYKIYEKSTRFNENFILWYIDPIIKSTDLFDTLLFLTNNSWNGSVAFFRFLWNYLPL